LGLVCDCKGKENLIYFIYYFTKTQWFKGEKMRVTKVIGQEQYRSNLYWAISVLLFLVMIELWGGYQLCSRNLWVRIIKVKSLQSLQVKPVEPKEYYRKKIMNQAWFQSKDPMEQYLGALQWTMNQVRKISYNPKGDDPVALLQSVESGSGALCGDIADLYRNVLAAIGKPSRKIWLYRDLFNQDTHATVEVLLNGKWILICPTFGIFFTNSEGQILSVQDLKKVLFKGNRSDIHFHFNKEVSYPARIENYYLDYLLLFNNVFVVEKSPNLLRQIPPFCFWIGTKLYYEKLFYESQTQIQFLQQLYFLFAIVFPVIILILTGFILYIIAMTRVKHDQMAH
jgi:hypothetical protein